MRRTVAIGMLALPVLLAGAAGGCNMLAYPLACLAQPREKTVAAEYPGLKNSSVAVVIYADLDTQTRHTGVREGISAVVADELRRGVEGVQVLPVAPVLRYQAANPYWDAEPKTEIARQLGAEHLLLITLIEFRTREPGSLTLYRGRLTADAALYKAGRPEAAAQVWQKRGLRVRYPEHSQVGTLEEAEDEIRYRTAVRFAQELVLCFRKHKVSAGP